MPADTAFAKQSKDVVQDIFDTLSPALPRLKDAVAYYDQNDDMKYITGGYVLRAGGSSFLARKGSPLTWQLYWGGEDGVKSAAKFVTQREAEQRRDAWNAALTDAQRAEGQAVEVVGHQDACRSFLRNVETSIKACEDYFADLEARNLYGDPSGPAQDFDANEGRYL